MNNKDTLTIVLFSTDLVFNQIIKRVLEKTEVPHKTIIYSAFSDANRISEQDDVNLIIVNDLIIGTSSHELISFLRLNRKISCPLIYFGVSEYEGKRKALMTGANYFINKPFHPDDVLRIIQEAVSTKKEKA